MGKKAPKASRKFAASGQLKKTIQARHKHQQIKRKIISRKGRKDSKANLKGKTNEREQDGDERDVDGKDSNGRGKQNIMSVDDILGAGFMEGEDEDEDDMGVGEEDESDNEGNEDSDADDASFASLDDMDDEGETHKLELSKLAEKDPEFYKYLQENDQELLRFDSAAVEDDSESDVEGGEEMEEDEDNARVPVLTKEVLKKWQKALLETRSLRALRKLLIAFRSAAHMNEESQGLAWTIDNSSVYNKLVVTALRYTPVVLEHHIPYKTLSNGKFKPPTQTPKQKSLQKLILSYLFNIIHVLGQLSDVEMQRLALSESAKLVPYIVSSRKAVKLYLKTCVELWSSAEDTVRIAAFLAIRRLTSAPDESLLDMVLKSTYLTLVRRAKSTSTHTLPSIHLMKNSASEVYCSDHEAAYQHAFGYIRQLAVHLRNSMKVKSKEAYKQVYNWQYVHSIDFWALVLARACDAQAEIERGGEESPLKALIYPLVQVALGAIKLIGNTRSYPFHLQIIRSLLHLTRHTRTYIPMSPYLLPIITSIITPSSRPKPSTLRPLDMDVHIRAPAQYLKTRVYSESVVEEAIFLLGEWLASPPVQASIAFPEIVVPLTVVLRKSLKKAGHGGKEVSMVKSLVERIEESAKWVEQRRSNVKFAPSTRDKVMEWEAAVKLDESPMGKYIKVQRKSREKRRKLVEKARDGEDEILDN